MASSANPAGYRGPPRRSFAVVGLGRIGAGCDTADAKPGANYAGSIASVETGQLAFGIDPDIDRRLKFESRYESPTYPHPLDALEALGKPDIWIVCPPTGQLMAVARSLIDITPDARFLVEKPLAYSSEHIELAASWPADRIRVGYTRAYLSSTEQLAEIVASGRLGCLLSIDAMYSRGFLNNASHLIHLIQRLFGAVQVQRVLPNDSWHPGGDLSADVTLVVRQGDSSHGAVASLIAVDSPDRTVATMEMKFAAGVIRYHNLGGRIEILGADGRLKLLEEDLDLTIREVVSQLLLWMDGRSSLGCTLVEALATSQILREVIEF